MKPTPNKDIPNKKNLTALLVDNGCNHVGAYSLGYGRFAGSVGARQVPMATLVLGHAGARRHGTVQPKD
jgi:hypothetical protein